MNVMFYLKENIITVYNYGMIFVTFIKIKNNFNHLKL